MIGSCLLGGRLDGARVLEAGCGRGIGARILLAGSPFRDFREAQKFAGPLPFTLDYEINPHERVVPIPQIGAPNNTGPAKGERSALYGKLL